VEALRAAQVEARALEALMGQAAREEWVTTTQMLEEALQTVQTLQTSEREAKALAKRMTAKARKEQVRAALGSKLTHSLSPEL
jgi:hypothetical protein